MTLITSALIAVNVACAIWVGLPVGVLNIAAAIYLSTSLFGRDYR